MKKIVLACAVAVAGLVNAQEVGNLKVGAHVGLPTGDLADSYTLNAGVDLAYTYNVSPDFKLGVTTGYSNYFGDKITILGEEIEIEDYGIVPIAATAEYSFTPQFYLGTDLGYAFGTSEGSEGAFYYQPKVGYRFGVSELYLGYKGMSKDGDSVSSVNLGYAYTFEL
ncbi:MAG: hypothetical protein ACR2MS_12405 [Weeksellaceae bacterium]